MRHYNAIIVLSVLVLLVVGYYAFLPGDMSPSISSASNTTELWDRFGALPSTVNPNSNLRGEIPIGVILPLTGNLAAHGEENLEGTKLGVNDFNEYLERHGVQWRMSLVVENSETNPVVALEKATSLKAKGIDIIIGPESSSSLRNIKGYVDSNNMISISCCSSAPSLAIPNDFVFRLVPDDTNQSAAMARLLDQLGIEVIIPIWRDDPWGNGLGSATVSKFASYGGTSDEPIHYNPNTPDFSSSTSLLADHVRKYTDEYDKDKIAIVVFSFYEVLQLVQSASEHDILDDIRWFGPASIAKSHDLVDDPIASRFTESTRFTAIAMGVPDNVISNRVYDHVFNTLGRVPSSFVQTSYDAPWLIGLSMLYSYTDDTTTIGNILPDVMASHVGATGSGKFNDAGDRAQANYDVWVVHDGKWNKDAQYLYESNIVEFY